MPLAFTKGQTVRQKAVVIQGEIVKAEIVDCEVQFSVSYVGADGETHERFFREDEIELVAAEPAVPEA
jgi:hypothetical protein